MKGGGAPVRHAGRADGRHQSAFHRRFPRYPWRIICSLADRQPSTGATTSMAARAAWRRDGYERPRCARSSFIGRVQRLSARSRYHGGIGDHGVFCLAKNLDDLSSASATSSSPMIASRCGRAISTPTAR
jgi:hypothetical protein